MQSFAAAGEDKRRRAGCARGANACLHIVLAAFTLIALTAHAVAQQTAPWIEFTTADGSVSVSLPNLPKEEFQAGSSPNLRLHGHWYSAGNADASYALWYLLDSKGSATWDADTYLDAAADVFWDTLLAPARDNLPEDQRAAARMTYVKELPAQPLAGREYTLTLGNLAGTAHVYVAEQRVIILLAMDRPGSSQHRQKFFGSLSFSASLRSVPSAESETSAGMGQITSNEAAPLRSSEVEQRARVLEKSEPSYTESARRFSVTGTVVLRCVFSYDGEVKALRVIRRLPHGLTEAAMRAARAIRFEPAVKNGKPVSIYMQLEYNFNLF